LRDSNEGNNMLAARTDQLLAPEKAQSWFARNFRVPLALRALFSSSLKDNR
jgi:hypothetical protein